MSDIDTSVSRRRSGAWTGWFELLVGLAVLVVTLGVALEARERVFVASPVEPSVSQGQFGDARRAIVELESAIDEFTNELLSARLRSEPLAQSRLDAIESDWVGTLAAIDAAFAGSDFDSERRLVDELSRRLSAVLVSLSTVDPTPETYDDASTRLVSISDELGPLRSAIGRAESARFARDQRALENAADTAVGRLGSDIAIVAAAGLALALSLVSISSGVRRIRRANRVAQARNSSSTESSSNTARSASEEITRSARNDDDSDHSEPSADSRTVSPASVRLTVK